MLAATDRAVSTSLRSQPVLRPDGAAGWSAPTPTRGRDLRHDGVLDHATPIGRPRQRRPGRSDRWYRKARRCPARHAEPRLRQQPEGGRPGVPRDRRYPLVGAPGPLRPGLAALRRRAEGRAGERDGGPATVPRLCPGPRGRRGQAAPRGLHRLPVGALGVGRRGQGPFHPSGAYHLVWSRDSYQFGTALWAMGDRAAARRMVDWLFGTQQKSDGSFPQNSDVSGKPCGRPPARRGRPPDRARPSHRASRDAATWRGVRKAADFLVSFRDEETGHPAPTAPRSAGRTSPATRPTRSRPRSRGLSVPRTWPGRPVIRHSPGGGRVRGSLAGRGEALTVTKTARSRPADFLRLTKDGRPNRGTTYALGDGGPKKIDQRRVVDPASSTWCGSACCRPRPGGSQHLRRGRRAAQG